VILIQKNAPPQPPGGRGYPRIANDFFKQKFISFLFNFYFIIKPDLPLPPRGGVGVGHLIESVNLLSTIIDLEFKI
jgi:hypothetical protein